MKHCVIHYMFQDPLGAWFDSWYSTQKTAIDQSVFRSSQSIFDGQEKGWGKELDKLTDLTMQLTIMT